MMSERDVPPDLRAGYNQCRDAFRAEDWSQAARLADQLVLAWADRADMSLPSRALVASVLMYAARAADQLASDEFGLRGPGEYARLDRVVKWSQAQAEVIFRQSEATAIALRMTWFRGRSKAVEALEDLADVFERIGDANIVDGYVSTIAYEMPFLLVASDDDQARYLQGMQEQEDDDVAALDPDELGVSDELISIMDRLVEACDSIANLLDDEMHRQALALILILKLSAVGRLGREDQAEYLTGRLARLGQPAIDACDELLGYNADRSNLEHSTVGIRLLRVTILWEQDRHELALAEASAVINEYSNDSDPTIVVLVAAAEKLRRAFNELENDG